MNTFECFTTFEINPIKAIIVLGGLFLLILIMLKIDNWFWKIGVMPMGLINWFKSRKG